MEILAFDFCCMLQKNSTSSGLYRSWPYGWFVTLITSTYEIYRIDLSVTYIGWFRQILTHKGKKDDNFKSSAHWHMKTSAFCNDWWDRKDTTQFNHISGQHLKNTDQIDNVQLHDDKFIMNRDRSNHIRPKYQIQTKKQAEMCIVEEYHCFVLIKA